MAGDTTVFALVAATVVATLAAIHFYPDVVRDRFFQPIESMRTLIGVIILVAGAWYALNSGVAWMIGVALVGTAFVTALFYFEEPHREIR